MGKSYRQLEPRDSGGRRQDSIVKCFIKSKGFILSEMNGFKQGGCIIGFLFEDHFCSCGVQANDGKNLTKEELWGW